MKAIVKGKLMAIVPQKTQGGKDYHILQVLQEGKGAGMAEMTNVKLWGLLNGHKINTAVELEVVIKPFLSKKGNVGLDVMTFGDQK
jgi:hypothetical protein